MKFRTEIEIKALTEQIKYSSRVLCLGSCFATSIGTQLRRAKFHCEVNPTGVLFNPLSIASTLELFKAGKAIAQGEFIESEGVWFHYAAHGSLSSSTAETAAEQVNSAIELGHNALLQAEWIILTLGSAWVYRLKSSGEVVANCHKQPSCLFSRELLSVEEISTSLESVMQGALRGKNIILTLSPIRHLADGLEQNSLSKATLRLAIETITKRYGNAHYFPSYEILLDDLRDYRYYGEDMVHPSKVAVDYIWQLFKSAAISPQTQRDIELVNKIIKATEHRPMHKFSESYATFCRRNIELIDQIKGIEFTAQREHFEEELRSVKG